MKRIDVLLAAYEGAAWLPDQLASLRSQDDGCFRVLMQDDGSSDGTMSILSDAAASDPRFRLGCEQGRRFGAIGNFWSLLRQTDASYIALCDQDDIWENNRISMCREVMSREEKLLGDQMPILVHSDCVLISADGAVIHPSFFKHQGWDPKAVTLKRLLVQNNVTGCAVLINRVLADLALKYGDPGRMVMHDWFLALTAAAFGRVVFIPEKLVRYRQHAENVKGASSNGLFRRGIAALGTAQRGRARVALTYRHLGSFMDMYRDELTDDAKSILINYLATEKKDKISRIFAVQLGGYTMQSPVTRAGQIIFG